MLCRENSSEVLMTDCCGFFPLCPFCSNFSSSHFDCSPRAEELRWCSWGQLHGQRGRGKHHLHYSRLERIYVQYLAFGTHAQVTARLIHSLFACASYRWAASCKPQVLPGWCCSAPKRISHAGAATWQQLDKAVLYHIIELFWLGKAFQVIDSNCLPALPSPPLNRVTKVHVYLSFQTPLGMVISSLVDENLHSLKILWEALQN